MTLLWGRYCFVSTFVRMSRIGLTHSTTTVSKDLLKVNSAVEVERAILKNINPVSFEVSRGVEHRNLQPMSAYTNVTMRGERLRRQPGQSSP